MIIRTFSYLLLLQVRSRTYQEREINVKSNELNLVTLQKMQTRRESTANSGVIQTKSLRRLFPSFDNVTMKHKAAGSPNKYLVLGPLTGYQDRQWLICAVCACASCVYYHVLSLPL